MKIALVDNGSLEPAAHLGLRRAAASIASIANTPVEAVSWKHSDRICPSRLEGRPAIVISDWIRSEFASGERDFSIAPFFVSVRGAIADRMDEDLKRLRSELGEFRALVGPGLAEDGSLARIVADRIRDTIFSLGLARPQILVVDHGGPSPASARLRNRIASEVAALLGDPQVRAASMESPDGEGFAFNRPLLETALKEASLGEVVIAPLFLLPGRHAGPGGDLARIAYEAQAARPGLRCHFTELVGSHPLAASTLAKSLFRQAQS